MNSFDLSHCDLKLENVLFKSPDSYEVALIDFGLAHRHKQFNWEHEVGGTPGYLVIFTFENDFML